MIKVFFSAALLIYGLDAALADLQPQALGFANVYAMGEFSPNLTGKGVSIGAVCRSVTYAQGLPQNDYQVDVSHSCFADGKVRFFNADPNRLSISKHSTAIASILVGYDEAAYFEPLGIFPYEGAAPDADLNVYEFWGFVTDYVYAGRGPEVDLLTVSLGWCFEDWWTRGIENLADRYGLLVVAAVGNGKEGYDTPLYPAAGANVLAVGVLAGPNPGDLEESLKNFTTPDANHSTFGPTIDGRSKPDIVAPGNCLAAFAGSENFYEPTGNYSSFAAPVVAGAAALLVQEAKSDPNLQFALLPRVGNCVLKSVLMTSASKLEGWHKGGPAKSDDFEYPLDIKQGAGLVDGLASLKLLKSGMQGTGEVPSSGWDVNVLEFDYSDEKVYRLKVDSPADKSLCVTLVWNRTYQNRYPFRPVLETYSDLRLELWGVGRDGSRESRLIDFSDSPVDNVEHIYAELDRGFSDYELVVSNSPGSALAETGAAFAVSWQLQ